MEQVNFGYSTKNIPVPNNDVYLQILLTKWRKFTQNARKEAEHFLKKTVTKSEKEQGGKIRSKNSQKRRIMSDLPL